MPRHKNIKRYNKGDWCLHLYVEHHLWQLHMPTDRGIQTPRFVLLQQHDFLKFWIMFTYTLKNTPHFTDSDISEKVQHT